MTTTKAFFAAAALLPCAVLAQVAPASGSSVQLYGRLDASVNTTRINGAGNRNTVTSDTSFWGLRGTEDLGDGLGAFFKLESQIGLDTGASGGTLNLGNGATPPVATPTATYFNREAHVGLRSAQLGQLSLGTHWSPSVLVSAMTDPFLRSQMGGQTPLLQGTATRGYSLQFVNSAQYITPEIAGVEGRLIVQASEGTFTKNYAALVKYQKDRLFLAAFHDNVQVNLNGAALGVAPNVRSGTTVLATSYRLDSFKLSGFVQQNRVSGLPNVLSYDLGLSVPVGQGEWRASYAHTNNPGKDASLLAVGYNYFLSKRTQLYTTVARLNNSAGARFALFPTVQDGAAPTAGGQNVTGAQVGIRHFF